MYKFMSFSKLWDLQISRLGIGTVQFGLDYGINNPRGRVPFSDILKIFEIAIRYGVNFIDTSRFYGMSEKNIGKALSELGLAGEFVICTKLDISKNYREKSDREILIEVDKALSESLEALRLEKIPVYLLHDSEQRTFRNGLIWNFLREKQQEGLIEHLGVSVAYSPKEASEALEDSAVEALQIPFNVFDQRWKKSGFFTELANVPRDVALFTRSSYLQGLLVMPLEKVPPGLEAAKEYKITLNKIANDLGMDVKELVLRYVFSINEVTSTIVGVDSPEQFEENISFYKKGSLEKEIITKIELAFKDIPESIVNPVFWKGEREKYEKRVAREVANESN